MILSLTGWKNYYGFEHKTGQKPLFFTGARISFLSLIFKESND